MFTEEDTWQGGSIELLVALGPSSTMRQLRAMQAVWRWEALAGPYSNNRIEPENQKPTNAGLGVNLYGAATLPDGRTKVAFSTSIVEDEDGAWLYAGVPMGSLAKVYPVGAYPFGDDSNSWQHELYEWLSGLAQHLFQNTQFERGMIGWITTFEVAELAAGDLPMERYHGYLLTDGSKLQYFAPNRSGALFL